MIGQIIFGKQTYLPRLFEFIVSSELVNSYPDPLEAILTRCVANKMMKRQRPGTRASLYLSAKISDLSK